MDEDDDRGVRGYHDHDAGARSVKARMRPTRMEEVRDGERMSGGGRTSRGPGPADEVRKLLLARIGSDRSGGRWHRPGATEDPYWVAMAAGIRSWCRRRRCSRCVRRWYAD